jgi:methionyl aminopeptidase
MTIDSEEDLEGLRRAGLVVAEARDAMVAAVEPGVTTGELDAIGRETFRRHGARSAPRVTYNFPGSTCVSINSEAAHGIPSLTRHLHGGDLVNIDVSAELDGYFSDTGVSTSVGVISPLAQRLLDATRLAQREAMISARAGNRLRDIGRTVEFHARRHGFRVIRNLYGHGIGRGLHEEPSLSNFDDHQRLVLREGMVLAVEPFLSVSANFVVDDPDGWTVRTNDGSLAAQFEHTMVVTGGAPIVLTERVLV